MANYTKDGKPVLKDLRKDQPIEVDAHGVELQEAYNEWLEMVEGREGQIRYDHQVRVNWLIGYHHSYVYFMGRDKWRIPKDKQGNPADEDHAPGCFVRFNYKGTDGKNYDAVRPMTETEKELFLYIKSIRDFIDF